jgi:hypothetical protein
MEDKTALGLGIGVSAFMTVGLTAILGAHHNARGADWAWLLSGSTLTFAVVTISAFSLHGFLVGKAKLQKIFAWTCLFALVILCMFTYSDLSMDYEVQARQISPICFGLAIFPFAENNRRIRTRRLGNTT